MKLVMQWEFCSGIESERVGYAVKFNTFGSNTNFLSKDCNNSTIAGLWFEPSFLNHDDNPNVCWAVIGNLMVARASSDIAGNKLHFTLDAYGNEVKKRKNIVIIGHVYI